MADFAAAVDTLARLKLYHEAEHKKYRALALEMLSALRGIIDDVDRSTPVAWRKDPKWDAARAVIAKADETDIGAEERFMAHAAFGDRDDG